MISAFGLRASGFGLAIALASTLSAQPQPTLEQVVERMHAYLDDNAKRLPAMIATETYEQKGLFDHRKLAPRHCFGLSCNRTLVSDYAFIQRIGEPKWQGFREVLFVDDKAVTDSGERLMSILADPSPSALRQARRIAEESTRYNIGPVARTINDPAVVLEILDRHHGEHLRYERGGESTVDGMRVWVIRFEEIGRSTVIHTSDGKSLPVKGRAWVQPDSGSVARAELMIEPGLGSRCRLEVSFRMEPRLGVAVPARMSEEYYDANRVMVSSGDAAYTNYREFTVDVRIR